MYRVVMIAMLVFVVACGQDVENKREALQEERPSKSSLQDMLDARKANSRGKRDTAKSNAYAKGIAEVANSGIYESAKNTGDEAPGFALNNASGEQVTLESYLEKGPVVLMWYRGGWCPYCNITLSAMQNRLTDIQDAGGQLIALTPEVPDSSLSTKEKNELQFEVLSDIDNEVAKKYGIVFKLNDKVAEYYNNGFGLQKYNGNENNELPLAATYVIDKNGVIRYTFLDADYTKRAEPDTVINVLKRLK